MKPMNLGGQAVMEGVMIQAPRKVSMAVRRKDGDITLCEESFVPAGERHPIAKWPVVRGMVNLCTQLGRGYRMLMKSADYIAKDEGEEQQEGGFGLWGALATVVAVALAIGLFVVLPSLLTQWLWPDLGNLRFLVEGLFRILILVLYMASISLMKDMKRMFMYHGAEHRVLHCYEHGVEPTPENSRQFPVVHPRCGTSYLFLVMVVSILVFAVVGRGSSLWMGMLLRIVCLPLVAGLAYELLRFAARHENLVMRIIRAPGLWLQRLSTRIPDDDMIEVAAAAYRAAMRENDQNAEGQE